METKANYVAVGAFVLVCMLGLVVTLLWFAGAQYSQEYVYYQTSFKGPVTGLGDGTVVRFNGIDVGRVTDLSFDPNDPQRVIAKLQLRPNLHIREDSVASIESEGLTGGSYVEISGGTKKSPELSAPAGQIPVIKSSPSTLQQLEQSAPQLVAKLNLVADKLNDMLGDKNRKALSDVLANLDTTTAALARRSGDIDATLVNFSQASKNLAQASKQMTPMIADADKTVKSFGKLSTDADAFVNGEALGQFADLLREGRAMVASLTRLSNDLDRQPTKLLFGDRYKGYTPK
ncbi:MAG: MCE family protein [Alphaproteobacteria bacterium]|nr:MCE family protein [Alphaproteobacteria bacterium]MBV9694152.1 MCE family protein [Alphaproteobacteria bacterium]